MHKHHKKTLIKQNIWPDAGFQMAATGIAAFLCFYSALWMLQDIFPDWNVLPQTHLVAAFLILFTAAVYEIGIRAISRWQTIFRLLVPVIYAAGAYHVIKPDRIDFEDGACAFVSQYLEKWNRQMKTDWVIWHGKTEWIAFSFSICFVLALLVVMSLALCVGRRMVLLILPVAALCLTLLAGFAPGQKGIGFLFVAWLFLSACSESGRHSDTDIWRFGKRGSRRGRLAAFTVQGKKRRFFIRLSRILVPVGAAVYALIVYVACSVFLEVPASELMNKTAQAIQFQRSAEQRISQVASAFFTPRNVGVNNTAPRYTGREVMKITVSQKPRSDLYLKGFCATDYENGKWEYHDRLFADACAKDGYQEQNAAEQLLNMPYQLYQTSPNKMDRQEVEYTIQYTGLWNRFAYLPYLVDLSALRDEVTFLGDGTIQKNWGKRTIHARGINHGLGYNVSEFTPQEGIPDLCVFYDKFVEEVYRDQLEYLAGIGTDDENYEVYLQVLQDMVTRNDARILYAQYICGVLKENCEYSLNLPEVPKGEDPIEYFINESGKGYCVHFASAAVQMMQNWGIPARYVSGYHVDRKSFQESEEGYTVSVKDEDAHAWVEIYLRNTGWIPIDPTPSSRERARQNGQAQAGQTTDTDTQAKEQETDSQDEQQPEETQADQEDEKDQKETENQGGVDGNGRKSWQDKIRRVCIFVLPLLAIFLTVVLLYRLVYMYRSFPGKEIQKGMYCKAVKRINRRIYRKLRMRGKAGWQNMTDAAYEKELKAAYQTISGQDWEHYIEVTKAAVFSGNGISREDACFCFRIYNNI